MDKSAKKFRLSGKQLFLTYPQCPGQRQELLDHMKKVLEPRTIENYFIVKEDHAAKDGEEEHGEHFHCYLELDKACDIRNARRLDFNDHHGKYEVMQDYPGTLRYLMKEDKEPLVSFDPKEALSQVEQHKTNKSKAKNKNLLERVCSEGVAPLILDGTVSIMNTQKLISNYEAFKKLTHVDTRISEPEKIQQWGIDFKIIRDPMVKKSHYWIFSYGSNYGKTTFAMDLIAKYRAQLWNPKSGFQAQIRQDTEIIIFDEFKGSSTIQELNSVMDGTQYYCGKGENPFQLPRKPVVFILSNSSPSEVYNKTDNLRNLLARINIIDLELMGIKPYIEEEPLEKETKMVPAGAHLDIGKQEQWIAPLFPAYEKAMERKRQEKAQNLKRASEGYVDTLDGLEREEKILINNINNNI